MAQSGLKNHQSAISRPYAVKNLTVPNKTINSVFLIWDKPLEYSSHYVYRVQTNTTVPSIYMTSESANITALIPGETYTFTVYTRAYNDTEGDPVSVTTCTLPGQILPQDINVSNKNSTSFLEVKWSIPAGKVDYYNVFLRGELNKTIQTSGAQVNFTDLLPGREYSITIQTVSGNCSQTSGPVTEATYPSQPGALIFTNIETNNIYLAWGDPIYMNNVTKSLIISYTDSSGTSTATSNTLNVNLAGLVSGMKYEITVVTVGAKEYQSVPVRGTVTTKPNSVIDLSVANITTDSVSLTWKNTTEYKDHYTFRVQTSTSFVIEQNAYATIGGLTPGETYTFTVFVRAYNETEGDPVNVTACTIPDSVHNFQCRSEPLNPVLIFTWQCPIGVYTSFDLVVNNNTDTIRRVVTSTCISGGQNVTMTDLSYYTEYAVNITTLSCDKKSETVLKPACWTAVTSPPVPSKSVVQTCKTISYDKVEITFEEFDGRNGRILAYAVIITTDVNEKVLPKVTFSKTYNDFKDKNTLTYVSWINKLDVQSGRTNRGNLITMQVGDGSKSGGYYNGPLQPLTTYYVHVAAFTGIDYDNKTGLIKEDTILESVDMQSATFQTPQNPGVIAGAVVGCILGSAAIGIMGFFIWRRRRQTDKKPQEMSFSKIKTEKKSHAWQTANFESHFIKQQADSNLGFSEEYYHFGSVGIHQPKSAAEIPENKAKNRYTNVLPYDFSRVELSILDHYTDDYINANYIPGYTSKTEFIAAQGPLPQTVQDFWRMVWEKNVCAIVMLTKCVETGKIKCEEYWPTNHIRSFGNLTVSLTSVSDHINWTIREFTIENNRTNEVQNVRHFHFTAWPDHGVPQTTDVLINFRNLVCDYVKHCPLNSPILVHCSAGVGRTGTLIALDRIMRQIEAEDTVDVFGVVYDLRRHRVLMVQTESQYIFLNQCALDYIKSRKDPQPDLIYQNSGAMDIYENISPHV
ncbi:receptor-type tyrosine-protein phosphatase eta [Discoglossus pictus]